MAIATELQEAYRRAKYDDATYQAIESNRNYIRDTGILKMLVDKAIERIENDDIRTAEIPALYKVFAPYSVHMITEDKPVEEKVIEEVKEAEEKPTKENALRLVHQIQGEIKKLRSV
ncbi:hypothetical protein JXH92_003670 [Salmonella enterica subsp. enterica serovar 4,[5],12:b:-]|nr:hypothetical protein [Salmonella enterica subsp. enterica serovar 4,[5],12:b:-]